MMRKPKEHHKTPEGSTFKHFRRLLGYVRPHKRYLVPALACVLLMAITYSASIGSILPVLTVMVKPKVVNKMSSLDSFWNSLYF